MHPLLAVYRVAVMHSLPLSLLFSLPLSYCRERRKKLLKLLELQEERERVMAEYEKRKEEKRRQRQLAQSQEKLMVDAS